MGGGTVVGRACAGRNKKLSPHLFVFVFFACCFCGTDKIEARIRLNRKMKLSKRSHVVLGRARKAVYDDCLYLDSASRRIAATQERERRNSRGTRRAHSNTPLMLPPAAVGLAGSPTYGAGAGRGRGSGGAAGGVPFPSPSPMNALLNGLAGSPFGIGSGEDSMAQRRRQQEAAYDQQLRSARRQVIMDSVCGMICTVLCLIPKCLWSCCGDLCACCTGLQFRRRYGFTHWWGDDEDLHRFYLPSSRNV